MSETLQESFRRVLELQRSWTGKNSPEMQERGKLIRSTITAILRRKEAAIRKTMPVGGADLEFEGRDATGNKSQIPWVRFFSLTRSPSAHIGWYNVYLFHAKGNGLYFGLWHGTTRWVDGQPVPRTAAELDQGVAWARSLVEVELTTRSDLTTEISLAATRSVGKSYEKGCAAAVWYPFESLPDDAKILHDAEYFASLLDRVYDAQDHGREPNADAPEIAAAKVVVEATVNPQRTPKRRPQGYLLSAIDRAVIEKRGMAVAHEWLIANGYSVRDVSSTESYDFEATSDGKRLFVEIKATTGMGDEILMTRNEVELHRSSHPNNMLIVVHSIKLDRTGLKPVATGGSPRVVHPWFLDATRLRPMSYQYAV